VLLQGTTAVIEVMHFDLDAFFVTKRYEFLFYGIPRKGVSDA
jgi:hypothetical protein